MIVPDEGIAVQVIRRLVGHVGVATGHHQLEVLVQ